MATIVPKMDRIEVRVDPAHKRLFQQAADISGQTLTDFLIASLNDAAIRVIREQTAVQLSMRDSEVFVEALLNPAPANDRLRRAADRYSKRRTARR